ncbi:hypothetical protein ACP4OV_023280 [Aristida adscensionis]
MARGQLRLLLDALDVAGTQFYHFMAIMIAGMGLFTDAYDLFSVSLLNVGADCGWRSSSAMTTTTTDCVCSRPDQSLTVAITSIALCGTVPGALVFGRLGDKIGRKRIYGVTLLLMVVSSMASALSFGEGTGNLVVTVCFFRFWLGVGIGGDYPLSATIMSEYSNKRRRGAFMAAIFAMQGFGILAAGLVTMIVSAPLRNKSPCSKTYDYIWRIVLMFGAIPAALTFYKRMKMPETARFTALIAHDTNKATSDMSSVLNLHMVSEDDEAVNGGLAAGQEEKYGLFSKEFLRRHGIHLVGTTACWLLVDITFYSLNMFLTVVDKDNTDQNNKVERISIGKMAELTGITLGATLPGYFVSVALVDRIGRVRIQLLGFAMMSIFTLCLAVLHHYEEHRYYNIHIELKKTMYAITLFFANFGPNTTTFIIPAEIFPARLRSTCHGISAAVGKIGAIIGVIGFLYLGEKMLFVLFGSNLIGLAFTFLLPETKGRSLEEITGEMEEQAQDGAQGVGAEYASCSPVRV